MTHRILSLACTLVLSLALAGPAAAMNIDGTNFDDSVQLGGAALRLNGVGLRAVAWLKGYAAGLYLSERVATPEAAIAAPGPKRLQMKMLLEVEAEEFVKAIDKGIRRNTPQADQPKLAARQQQFRAAVLALRVVRRGDVIDLDYLPGRGMTMTVNGSLRGAPLPGDDFYAAVLRIFIGDRPVDDDLKAGLLGQRPPG